MRYVHCIIIAFLLLIPQVHADKTCKKIQNYIFEKLSETGTLKQDESGFVYVDIDDDYIYKLLNFIKDDGFEQPPYFYIPNGHGAHISVIYSEEAQRYDIGTIDEIDKPIYFEIKDCKIVKPPSWPGIESVYVITVKCPVLDKIRKRYGLPKAKFDYHITIGIKREKGEQTAA